MVEPAGLTAGSCEFQGFRGQFSESSFVAEFRDTGGLRIGPRSVSGAEQPDAEAIVCCVQ